MSRPDLFAHTLSQLSCGGVALELSDGLAQCVEAARTIGKQATITLKLTVKPVGQGTGQYQINDDVKLNIPQLEKATTIMFGTPDGNLQREDPRQQNLNLKSVDHKRPETFKNAEAEG